jgi:hypothetical protein
MGNALAIRMRKDSAVDKWFKSLPFTVCGLQFAITGGSGHTPWKNGADGTHETYGCAGMLERGEVTNSQLLTANRQQPTANRKPLC